MFFSPAYPETVVFKCSGAGLVLRKHVEMCCLANKTKHSSAARSGGRVGQAVTRLYQHCRGRASGLLPRSCYMLTDKIKLKKKRPKRLKSLSCHIVCSVCVRETKNEREYCTGKINLSTTALFNQKYNLKCNLKSPNKTKFSLLRQNKRNVTELNCSNRSPLPHNLAQSV